MVASPLQKTLHHIVTITPGKFLVEGVAQATHVRTPVFHEPLTHFSRHSWSQVLIRNALILSAFNVNPRDLANSSLPCLSRVQFLTIKSRSSDGSASRHFFMHPRRCSSDSRSDSSEDSRSSSSSHSLFGSLQCSSSTSRATP